MCPDFPEWPRGAWFPQDNDASPACGSRGDPSPWWRVGAGSVLDPGSPRAQAGRHREESLVVQVRALASPSLPLPPNSGKSGELPEHLFPRLERGDSSFSFGGRCEDDTFGIQSAGAVLH